MAIISVSRPISEDVENIAKIVHKCIFIVLVILKAVSEVKTASIYNFTATKCHQTQSSWRQELQRHCQEAGAEVGGRAEVASGAKLGGGSKVVGGAGAGGGGGVTKHNEPWSCSQRAAEKKTETEERIHLAGGFPGDEMVLAEVGSALETTNCVWRGLVTIKYIHQTGIFLNKIEINQF